MCLVGARATAPGYNYATRAEHRDIGQNRPASRSNYLPTKKSVAGASEFFRGD